MYVGMWEGMGKQIVAVILCRDKDSANVTAAYEWSSTDPLSRCCCVMIHCEEIIEKQLTNACKELSGSNLTALCLVA